jgi:hypothetical protein
MKKVTNKLLFSGLAVIIIAFFITVFSWLDIKSEEDHYKDIQDDTTEEEIDVKPETRQLEPFERIQVGVSHIKYVKSDKYELVIPYGINVNDFVDDNELIITTNDIRSIINNDTIVIYSPSCKKIETLFSSNIECDEIDSDTITIINSDNSSVYVDKMNSKRVKLVNKSQGDINIANIDADYLNVRTEEMGSVSISGTVRKAVISCEGSGKIDISGMTCPDISIQEGEENVITRKE